MTIDEQLTVDLWLLDAVLTGRDSRSGRGDENKIISVEDFALGEIFYLSDGGYSRVFFSESKKRIYLASESRDEVKEKWGSEDSSLDSIRYRIEERVRSWIEAQS